MPPRSAKAFRASRAWAQSSPPGAMSNACQVPRPTMGRTSPLEGIGRVTSGVVSIGLTGSWASAGRREQPPAARAATIVRRVQRMGATARGRLRSKMGTNRAGGDGVRQALRPSMADDPRRAARARGGGGALARTDARNALNGELMEELTEAAALLRLRTDVRAVILTGARTATSRPGRTCRPARQRLAQPSLIENRRAVMAGPDLCRAWREIEAVTIAAIEGYCIGGAAALVISCDFRVMGEGAYLRLPEVPLGMNMSWRSIPRIAALVGPSRAKQFVMFGEAVDAATCADWGFADEAVEKGAALAAAWRWADKVAALPPIPVRMTKEAVNAVDRGHRPGLDLHGPRPVPAGHLDPGLPRRDRRVPREAAGQVHRDLITSPSPSLRPLRAPAGVRRRGCRAGRSCPRGRRIRTSGPRPAFSTISARHGRR